jgi:hypothetical protein
MLPRMQLIEKIATTFAPYPAHARRFDGGATRAASVLTSQGFQHFRCDQSLRLIQAS